MSNEKPITLTINGSVYSGLLFHNGNNQYNFVGDPVEKSRPKPIDKTWRFVDYGERFQHNELGGIKSGKEWICSFGSNPEPCYEQMAGQPPTEENGKMMAAAEEAIKACGMIRAWVDMEKDFETDKEEFQELVDQADKAMDIYEGIYDYDGENEEDK